MHAHVTKRLAAVALLALTAAQTGAAQQTAGAPRADRWQAFLGCWTSAPARDALLPIVTSPTLVCITPSADANVVEVSTLTNGSVLTSRQRIDASGRETPIVAKDCTGTQSARWSADERRIYLKAVANCGGLVRTTSGILAMSPRGEWLDVQGIAAGEGENVRVARYRDAGVPSSVPEDIATVLSGRGVASQGARAATGAPVGSAAVIEASRNATESVVEAWLLERGQRFDLTGRDLIALADAGVPARVTDAMVAVSNPAIFAVAHSGGSRPIEDEVTGQRIHIYLDQDPWGWGYNPYGYSAYGYGLGYDRYGYGNSYGSYYGAGYPQYYTPVIIVKGDQASQPHGRMVRGHGYVGPGETGGGSTPTPYTGAASSGASSSSGSSAGSSSGSSSQPAPERTAKPRP
jgi:hypothetical protein